jgi:hypothetical protein
MIVHRLGPGQALLLIASLVALLANPVEPAYAWPSSSFSYQSSIVTGETSVQRDFYIDSAAMTSRITTTEDSGNERSVYSSWGSSTITNNVYTSCIDLSQPLYPLVLINQCKVESSSGTAYILGASVYPETDPSCGPPSVSQAGDPSSPTSVEIFTVICEKTEAQGTATTEYYVEWWAQANFPKSITTTQTFVPDEGYFAGGYPGMPLPSGYPIVQAQEITSYSLQAPLSSLLSLPSLCLSL